MKQTIFITNIDGKKLDVTQRYDKLQLEKPTISILNMIASPQGLARNIEGFKAFNFIRAVKAGITGLADPNSFPDARDQVVSAKMFDTKTNQDAVILRNWDGVLIDNNMEMVAHATYNFTNKFELDAEKTLLNKAITEIGAYKLYTDESDWTKTKAQPAQTDFSLAKAKEAVKEGKRVVEMTDTLFDGKENAIDLLREAVIKLEILGTDEDVEKTPYAYTGLDKLIIVGSPRSVRQLKGDGFVRVLNNGVERKLNAKVAELDGIEIVESRLLPSKVAFMVMTKRALFSLRTPQDPSVKLGDVVKAAGVQINGTYQPLSPNSMLIRFERPFMYGVAFENEIIAIKYKTA